MSLSKTQVLSLPEAIAVRSGPASEEEATAALASLLPRHAKALHLFYVEKRGMKEIAACLDVTPSRVSQIIYTALGHSMGYLHRIRRT